MATSLLYVVFLTWVVTLTLLSSSYATHPRHSRLHPASSRKASSSQAMTSQTRYGQPAEVDSNSDSPVKGGYSTSGATSRAAGERRLDGDLLETKDPMATCLGKDCAAQTKVAPSLSIQISTKVTRRKTVNPQLHHENSAFRQRLHDNPYYQQRGDSNKHQANTSHQQTNNPAYSKLPDVAKTVNKADHIVTETTPRLNLEESEIDKINTSRKNDSRINLFASLPTRGHVTAKGEQNKTSQEKHYSETLRNSSQRQQKSGTNSSTLLAALTPVDIPLRVRDKERHPSAVGSGEKRHETGNEKAAEKHHKLSTHEKADKRNDTGWRETERLHKERAGDGSRGDGSDPAARDRGSWSGTEPFKGRTVGPSRFGVFSDRKGTEGSGQSSADDFPHRPAAADRLEKRISPSLRDAGSRLVRSLRDALNMLLDGMQPVLVSNTFVFNSTRYTIMLGVREQLQEIAKANNMAYEAILRASLTTRNLYLRAQQRNEPKTHLLLGPQARLADFSDVIGAANKTKELAEQVLKTLQDRNSKQERLDLKLRQIWEKFRKEFGLSNIRELFYYINSTVNQLGSELDVSARTAYLRRNRAVLTSSASELQKARQILYNASNHIMESTKNYRGSYAVTQEWKHRRKTDGHVGPPVPFRRQHDGQTGAERMQVLQTIQRLKDHSREQESLSLKIERILRPSIIMGQKVVERSDVETSLLLLGLVSRLTEDGKKLYSVLEAVRLLIGADQALIWPPGLSSRQCPDEDFVEGSACEDTEEEGEEGSATTEPPSTTESTPTVKPPSTTGDDDDFIFIDKFGPPVRKSKPTSLEEFGDQLSVHVDGVKLRSNNILKQGDQLQSRIKPLSERWSQAKSNFQAAEQALEMWNQTKASLRNFTAFADAVHTQAIEIDSRVAKSKESIDKKMARVKEIAERKLAEVSSSKGNGDTSNGESSDQPSSDDTAILLQAVDKVRAVESERDAMRSLRTLTPRLCSQASSHLRIIQANVSFLQQQVHAARKLLHSMQLSLLKSSDGYLSIPLSLTTAGLSPKRFLSPETSPLSLVMTLQLCIRTQGKIEGPVLFVKGNQSASFSLAVSNQQLSVTVYDASGWKQETVSTNVTLQENTWYSVNITRTGNNVVLSVKSRAGHEDAVKNDVTVDKMAYFQPDPVHIYVGGVASNEPFEVKKDTWRGCLGDLHVNGHAVSLLHPSSTGAAPQLCQDQCIRSTEGESLVFDGTGFLHFPESVMPVSSSVLEVSFLFRTWQHSAAILQVYNKRQRFLLHVVLSEGGLMINCTTPRESKILRSQESNLNDGKFHSIKIQYHQDNRITPEIDGKVGVFTTERSRQMEIKSMMEGVIVGAFVNGSYAFEATKYRPLMGCVQKLKFADKPLDLSLAVASYGTYAGTCNTQSMWSQCVQFGPSSKGLDLGNFTHASTIILHFSPTARGPLLTYSKPTKFEAEIRATDKGLEISIAGKSSTIDRPDDGGDSFVMIKITDDGKSVTSVEAWEKTVSHTYGSFWDRFKAADPNAEHNIRLAQDNTDQKLMGQITQLVIGPRLIDLTSYIKLLQLSSCERLLQDLQMVHPSEESTSTPTLEKCNTDIQCNMAL